MQLNFLSKSEPAFRITIFPHSFVFHINKVADVALCNVISFY